MENIAGEVSQKLKSAIKAKLTELGAYVDDELSNYVMVMVTNRRSKVEMDRELQLFLGGNTSVFTTWLQSVFQKLEQVTIANPGKRKSVDKKKKMKKSSRCSSESEDDKKHKKKRKSSDTSIKEPRKKKTEPVPGVKVKKSPSESESDNEEQDDLPITKESREISASSSANEEFLNIKEDFETEFLSENELSEGDNNSSPDHNKKTASQALESKLTVKRRKNINVISNVDVVSEIKKSRRKPLVRDFKNRSPDPPSRTRSRSRSESQTKIIQLKRKDSDSTSDEIMEDSKVKGVRSRLKPPLGKCRSRSPSAACTISTKKLKVGDSSSLVDARELINRKRAKCLSSEATNGDKKCLSSRINLDRNTEKIDISLDTNELGVGKTIISGGKIIRLRDRERSKENYSVDENNIILDDDDDDDDEDENGLDESRKAPVRLIRKIVGSKTDGKRSVTIQSASKSSGLSNNKRIELRHIRRTVYVEGDDKKHSAEVIDDGDENSVEEKQEKKLLRNRKLKEQILKNIKPDNKTVASTVIKLPMPSRPKPSAAQSATSSLIRRAMADAHKSLNSIKDRKEEVDCSVNPKFRGNKSSNKNELMSSDNEEPAVKDDDESFLPQSPRYPIEHMNYKDEEEDTMKCDDQSSRIEEYDPSVNTPKFVVTLTGLDPKLFPTEGTEELMDTYNEEYDSGLEDTEKIKPKIQERCKYYPNCLAGNQCLYYHPTIACKLFPNCKFGNSCLYVHPKCKFDSMCTRYDCTFLHTTPKITVPVTTRHAAPPPSINAQPCKFYFNCANPICPFQHPKLCRFDRYCTNKNCTFSHTSLSHVSTITKDKLKWSRPKDDDKDELLDQKQENLFSNDAY